MILAMAKTFSHFMKGLVPRHLCLLLGSVGFLSSCTTPTETDEVAAVEAQISEAAAQEAPDAEAPFVKVSAMEWSLLEMKYEEAKAISPQHAEVGPVFRVVGDTVEVLKKDREGNPLKVKAKGHVFLEMALDDRATALCDEATITTKEALLYGGPMLMQNSRVAKSTSPSTSFRVTDFLKVTGDFKLINADELMQSILTTTETLDMPELKKTAQAE